MTSYSSVAVASHLQNTPKTHFSSEPSLFPTATSNQCARPKPWGIVNHLVTYLLDLTIAFRM